MMYPKGSIAISKKDYPDPKYRRKKDLSQFTKGKGYILRSDFNSLIDTSVKIKVDDSGQQNGWNVNNFILLVSTKLANILFVNE